MRNKFVEKKLRNLYFKILCLFHGKGGSGFIVLNALKASKFLNDLKSLLKPRPDDYDCKKLLGSAGIDMLEREPLRQIYKYLTVKIVHQLLKL